MKLYKYIFWQVLNALYKLIPHNLNLNYLIPSPLHTQKVKRTNTVSPVNRGHNQKEVCWSQYTSLWHPILTVTVTDTISIVPPTAPFQIIPAFSFNLYHVAIIYDFLFKLSKLCSHQGSNANVKIKILGCKKQLETKCCC